MRRTPHSRVKLYLWIAVIPRKSLHRRRSKESEALPVVEYHVTTGSRIFMAASRENPLWSRSIGYHTKHVSSKKAAQSVRATVPTKPDCGDVSGCQKAPWTDRTVCGKSEAVFDVIFGMGRSRAIRGGASREVDFFSWIFFLCDLQSYSRSS